MIPDERMNLLEPIRMRLTTDQDGPVLGCPRCDTALLPEGELPRGGLATVRCPLCGWEQPTLMVEVGGGEVFPYNPSQQQEDLAASPVFLVDSIQYDEDLCLVNVPGLLDDPAFFALQDGVAPVRTLGWVGGEGLMGGPGYRLFLVVRVHDQSEQDLFRVEFPVEHLAELGPLADDQTVVLVSERKGVLIGEAGEVYAEAVREAGGRPGDHVAINTWVTLEDEEI